MSTEIAKKIRIELINQGKNLKWLAEKMETSPADLSITLRRLEEGKDIGIIKLEKFSKALNLSFNIGA